MDKAWEIITPNDVEMRLLVHKSFYLKTGDSETLRPDVPLYSEMVTAILKKAQSLNFRPSHMEKACENFLFAKQYGGRIELADFFAGEERKEILSKHNIETLKKIQLHKNAKNG